MNFTENPNLKKTIEGDGGRGEGVLGEGAIVNVFYLESKFKIFFF